MPSSTASNAAGRGRAATTLNLAAIAKEHNHGIAAVRATAWLKIVRAATPFDRTGVLILYATAELSGVDWKAGGIVLIFNEDDHAAGLSRPANLIALGTVLSEAAGRPIAVRYTELPEEVIF